MIEPTDNDLTPLVSQGAIIEAWPDTDPEEIYIAAGDDVDCFATCKARRDRTLDYVAGQSLPAPGRTVLPYDLWLRAQRVNLLGPFTIVCCRALANRWWRVQNVGLRWTLFLPLLIAMILAFVCDLLVMIGVIVRAILFPLSWLLWAPFMSCNLRYAKGRKWCCIISTLVLRGSSGGDFCLGFGLIGRIFVCPALACKPWPTRDNPNIDWCC